MKIKNNYKLILLLLAAFWSYSVLAEDLGNPDMTNYFETPSLDEPNTIPSKAKINEPAKKSVNKPLKMQDEAVLHKQSTEKIPEELSQQKWKRYEATIGGSPVWNVTLVDSATVKLGLPPRSGKAFNAQLAFHPKEERFYFFAKHNRSSVEYLALPVVVPTNITQNRYETSAAMIYRFFRDKENRQKAKLHFGFGVTILQQSVTETSPNPVLTNYNKSGPTLFANYKTDFAKDWDLDAGSSVNFLSRFKEKVKTTGFYEFGINYELSGIVSYALSEWVKVSGGLLVKYENTYFNGLGTRGTRDATERMLVFSIPIALKIAL